MEVRTYPAPWVNKPPETSIEAPDPSTMESPADTDTVPPRAVSCAMSRSMIDKYPVRSPRGVPTQDRPESTPVSRRSTIKGTPRKAELRCRGESANSELRICTIRRCWANGTKPLTEPLTSMMEPSSK